MAGMDITSANSEVIVSCLPVGIVSVKLQGFSVDTGVSMDQVETAIARKGIDGYMAAGWVPSIPILTFSFEANSPSIDVFNAILTYSDSVRGLGEMSCLIVIPSINRSYNFGNGVITTSQMMPSLERVLAPQTYVCAFNQIKPSIIS